MSTDHIQSAQNRKPRRRWFDRGFIKNRDGATLVEFALLAFPFTLLIFAILETCISYAAEEYMQNVTDDVAREFRVGKLKAGTTTQTDVFNEICGRLEIFVTTGCPGLSIDLRTFNTFAEAAALSSYVTTAGEIYVDGGFQYKPGPSQSKNILRVYYRWPAITDILRSRMSNLKDGAILHFATATWQNEPFED